jgi:nucleotide-binding universal stress UspA family protein
VKRLLIPVDGSARSLDAVRAAVREGAGAIERIDLINVQPLLNRHIARWLSRAQREAWRRERSEKALGFARKIVLMAGIPCEAHAAAGTPATVIAAAARRLRSHEIVLGSRRRSLLARLLSNSLSAQLLAVAPIPVRVIL